LPQKSGLLRLMSLMYSTDDRDLKEQIISDIVGASARPAPTDILFSVNMFCLFFEQTVKK
jgi:hypothetical protein